MRRTLVRERPLAAWGSAWLLMATVLLSSCISLPGPERRTTSLALPAGSGTPLGTASAADLPVSGSSGFRLLPSGPAALTARLELVQRAESSLDLQYFLLRADWTGLELLRSLRDAATRGVRVRLLLDDLYAPGDELLLSLAAFPNVEVRLFNPLPLRNPGLIARFAASPFFFEQLNHRMHNKLFVADGVLAITGGRNIADEYFSRRLSANFVDLDVLAAGAIVAEMSASFDTYWNSSLAYPVLEVAAKPALSVEALQRSFDTLVGQAVAPERAMPSETDVFGRPSLELELKQGQWDATLRTYAFPVVGDMHMRDITTEHVVEILSPIWTTKTETATRVRARLESVIAFGDKLAKVERPNPAAWKGNLSVLLAKPARFQKVEHHAALPWRELPAFMARLRAAEGQGARALEFAILTAARSGEARGATWAEVDLQARRWSVPAERMKGRREHRVPLSDQAVQLIERMPRGEAGDAIFPGARGKPLSDMTLLAVLRRMGIDATPHGFRSAFHDWASEAVGAPLEVIEAALAHAPATKVIAAYSRTDHLDRRAVLMAQWATYLDAPAKAERVVPIRKDRAAR